MKYLQWPDNIPSNNGYYVVEYHNPDDQSLFYKSVWFDGVSWIGWRHSGWASYKTNINDLVKKFYPDTYDLYYTNSMMKAKL